ncbi:hypothetical protein [Microbacterium sp. MYb62]|uniref:hypothetical protein n=1 Tax=Microbacterium sp. MYb62 TaxID=1848690 RepID=UPI000CFBC551|nr:hypothetical protein [Microbacterium sp. MYb62]PRB14477.1 hypothetical protein CQ042_11190 [Microbacterium sp. MYb62]
MTAWPASLGIKVRLRVDAGIREDTLVEVGHGDLDMRVPVEMTHTPGVGITFTMDTADLTRRIGAAAHAFEAAVEDSIQSGEFTD